MTSRERRVRSVGPRGHVTPARSVFLGFLTLNVIGTLVLALPATHGATDQTLLEAAFTAVSGACVTGLTVVDTLVAWNSLGHVVIALLIQLGGLGVMVFASLIGIHILRRFSMSAHLTTAREARIEGSVEVRRVVTSILAITLVVEGAVAIALTLRFLLGYGYDVGRAIAHGVFHAISSYNNAGFALYSDGITSFADDAWICVPLMLATIIGGLGTPVIVQLLRHGLVTRKWSMHVRIVLTATVVLLAAGAAWITVLEWSNPATLGAHEPAARVLIGIFHSVQTRTSGFNSIDVGAMHPVTLIGMDALMFIGGGPAGTAGGIKVTTAAVILAILVAEVRGHALVNMFGKRLSRAVHRQATAVVSLATLVVFLGTVTILLTTPHVSLGSALFEATSAFGTVGLSTGITAEIHPIGQLVVIVLMFIGRVGPITFASALALRSRSQHFLLPKERPIIG